jgi:hypothetical protein
MFPPSPRPRSPQAAPKPTALQVLLSQVHRLRALVLLGRFLDMGAWAVDLALSGEPGGNIRHDTGCPGMCIASAWLQLQMWASHPECLLLSLCLASSSCAMHATPCRPPSPAAVGIFPYVLKLLQTTAADLRQTLVLIWAKIMAWDTNSQVGGCGVLVGGASVLCSCDVAINVHQHLPGISRCPACPAYPTAAGPERPCEGWGPPLLHQTPGIAGPGGLPRVARTGGFGCVAAWVAVWLGGCLFTWCGCFPACRGGHLLYASPPAPGSS